VWSQTTDEGPYNGLLERPALRSLIPQPLAGATVLDAGCGAGAQCEWLADQGADVVGIDLSPAMVEQARRRCGDRARVPRWLVSGGTNGCRPRSPSSHRAPAPAARRDRDQGGRGGDAAVLAAPAAVLDAFAHSGFGVERVLETRPTAQALAQAPILQETLDVPSFIVYRLRRAPAD
jgi:SAM-dependent methyltransferase